MKSQYRVVVIGGGVVGASVLYHLAKMGWKDVVMLERRRLASGSSWHAAGGVHTLNADPNMAALQAYTIDLLPKIEKESGQNVGFHMTGGLTLAGTPERWEWLQSNYRIFQSYNFGKNIKYFFHDSNSSEESVNKSKLPEENEKIQIPKKKFEDLQAPEDKTKRVGNNCSIRWIIEI